MMNNLITNKPSMTSLEIAELVEKRHDNVKRTIETLIMHGVITSPQIEEKPTAGKWLSECMKRGATVVA